MNFTFCFYSPIDTKPYEMKVLGITYRSQDRYISEIKCLIISEKNNIPSHQQEIIKTFLDKDGKQEILFSDYRILTYDSCLKDSEGCPIFFLTKKPFEFLEAVESQDSDLRRFIEHSTKYYLYKDSIFPFYTEDVFLIHPSWEIGKLEKISLPLLFPGKRIMILSSSTKEGKERIREMLLRGKPMIVKFWDPDLEKEFKRKKLPFLKIL